MPHHVRRRLVLPAALLLTLLTAACGASDPPPTSPLDESAQGDGTVVGVPSVIPTFPVTATPGGGALPGGGGAAVDAEHLAGLAIEAIAEWLGQPATLFTLQGVEPVDWPNACLGVVRPGVACAEVVTPGARVTIQTFGGGATYFVHADAGGGLAWAPLMDAEREVAAVDAAAGRISLAPLSGSDEMGTDLLVVPGSRLDIPLGDLAPGDRVHVAVAPTPGADGGAAPVVWLVPVEG